MRKLKPVGTLLDELVFNCSKDGVVTHQFMDGWFFARPIAPRQYHKGVYRKISACIRILRNRGGVWYFKCDE